MPRGKNELGQARAQRSLRAIDVAEAALEWKFWRAQADATRAAAATHNLIEATNLYRVAKLELTVKEKTQSPGASGKA